MKTWVVVADEARARFFRVEKVPGAHAGTQYAPAPKPWEGELIELKDLAHAESLLPEREMETDEPGVVNVPGMHSKFGVDEKISPKEKEALRFAKTLAEALYEDVAEYDRLYLVAPPRFLGQLREKLDKHVLAKLVGEFHEELTHFPPEMIREHLPEKL